MAKKSKKRPGPLKARLFRPKPWVKLGLSRARYEAERMWQGMNISRAKFEALLEDMPQEAVDMLWEKAESEQHEEDEAAKVDELMKLLGFNADDILVDLPGPGQSPLDD